MTPPTPHRVAVVLLDIEGTTTSIDFVYDTLFPYARAHLRGFLARRFDDPEVRAALAFFPAAAGASPEAAADHALALMDGDVKDTGLKALQGLVWREGYAAGDLRGHVYDDVPGALRAFRDDGVPVHIYSSGSVEAQILLFRHAVAGDLTPLLAGHFDTTTGPKKEPASYAAIAARIGVEPGAIAFLTDSFEEARAADAAGVRAVLSVRPGNPALPAAASALPAVTSLAGLRDALRGDV
ncbi:MAG: acireductone synthase [Myxococcales bacterium]|nr:acireductone synthase [Myxococcales bacterium]